MIADALGDIPLIADADTGYGAPMNVVRTVRSYDAAGVAAIQLEDQVFPKRCGHLPDKQVVDAAVFEQTLAAALDARSDDNLLVVARTDARAPLGLDEAIERANRYAQAGADIIFVEAPQDTGEIERIAREVDAPLLINLVLGGMTPLESASRLQELGYAIAIHPSNLLMPATFGMLQSLCELNGSDIAAHTADQPRRLLQSGRHGRVAGPRRQVRTQGPIMGMTIIEKIFARKAGLDSVSPGDTVVVDVDMTVLIDLQFATMWIAPNRIHDPDKLAVVMDHAVPAPTIKDAAGGATCPKVRRRLRHRALLSTSAGTASATRSSPRTGWRAREKSWPAPTLTPAPPAPTTPRPAGWGPPRCIRSCAPEPPGSRSRRPSATNSTASNQTR